MDLETALTALQELWKAANLNHTPKLHSLLMHALPQMRMFGGIGDILEDDVEKMHQIAGQSESRVARLKSASSRALAEAKIEAISKNSLVKQHVEKLQQSTKRKFSDGKSRLAQVEKRKCLKDEHVQKEVAAVRVLCEKPPPKLVTAHERLKAELSK